MTHCNDCKKKIPIALAISTAKCSCTKLFCYLHKESHMETCEFLKKDLNTSTKLLSDKLLNGKSLENGKLIDRI